MEPFDRDLLPVAGQEARAWFEQDPLACDHARFCHPLAMANQLGFYLLSPATFRVSWDGDPESPASLEILDEACHSRISTHSAAGSFTVQLQFLPVTEAGVFTFLKGIPNLRRPYTAMEALVETWWNPAGMGLVMLCNGAGEFQVQRGEPIAQMIFVDQRQARSDLQVAGDASEVPHQREFSLKRASQVRPELDYMMGRYPDGSIVTLHFRSLESHSENQRKVEL